MFSSCGVPHGGCTVLPKRLGRSECPDVLEENSDAVLQAGSLRSASEPTKETKPAEEGISIFWRVFGGAILSISALVVITMFNNLMNTLTDLRSEINKLNEHRAELVKKDEFNTRVNATWERVQALQTQNNSQFASLTSYRTELDAIKERLAKHTTDSDTARREIGTSVEASRKELMQTLDSVKKDIATLEILKERVASLEALKKELAAIENLKDRLATLTADLKLGREEYLKIRQDVDKNQIADAERKLLRDEQYREHEKILKELQLSVQDCQVKLARFEGLNSNRPEGAPKRTPNAAPNTSKSENPSGTENDD